MGLLFSETAPGGGDFKTKAEASWLQEMGCKACPLNQTPGKIDATGAKRPEIYILGEAAGKDEEEQRRQFVGRAGQLLRELLPRDAIPLIRWNNVLNCHPPKNRDPSPQEISCCRPRVEVDIERSQPKAIWGFGNVPLKWVSGFSGGIGNWRGRRMPVRIGSHTCWYYPFLHPSFLSRKSRDGGGEFGSEEERMTWLDLRRAFADLDDLPTPVVHTPEMAKANVECITDIGQIRQALQWAAKLPYAGVDYETNRVRPYSEGAKILSASVGTIGKAYAFPIEHPGAEYTKAQIAEIKELWKRFLLNAGCVKRVHNLIFELEWSGYFFGHEVIRARTWECTANAASIVDERSGGKKMKSGPFSLEFLVQRYFGFNLKKLSSVNREKLEFTPLPTVLLYNGMDSKYHDGVGAEIAKEIKAEGLELAYTLGQRRIPTVALSQLRGVPVDQKTVQGLHKKYKAKVEAAVDAIQALPVIKKFNRQKGREFNPLSSPDLKHVFDEMLRCEEVWVFDKYKKEEKFSTEETVLDEIIKNHPEKSDVVGLAKGLIELRGVNGTKSKYIDALLIGSDNCVVYPDGMIHTNFNTFFAETGRLSSDEPNLQNFPKRDENTKEVRKSIAALRYKLYRDIILSFDYGQIEARVIAMFTKDPVFVKALWDRWDVHQDWAERLAYAYPPRIGGKRFIKDKKVMKNFRTDIKNQWTFPLVFGARDTSVAGYLNMPLDIIRQQIREFWKTFPAFKGWQDKQLRFYQEYGYVECLTGRRRHGPLTLNQIYNSPVQGTAAEIVLDAMSRLSEMGDPEVQPEINIHDDLTFLRVREDRADVVAEKVVNAMLAVPFKWVNVPITVEMSMGTNWCDMEEVQTFSSDKWEPF